MLFLFNALSLSPPQDHAGIEKKLKRIAVFKKIVLAVNIYSWAWCFGLARFCSLQHLWPLCYVDFAWLEITTGNRNGSVPISFQIKSKGTEWKTQRSRTSSTKWLNPDQKCPYPHLFSVQRSGQQLLLRSNHISTGKYINSSSVHAVPSSGELVNISNRYIVFTEISSQPLVELLESVHSSTLDCIHY